MGKIRGLLLIVIGLMTGLVLGKMVLILLPLELLASMLIALVVGTIAIDVFLQLRLRMTKTPLVCPKCAKPTTRVHRTRIDRLLSIIIPNLRRYACSEPVCQWTGLIIVKDDSIRAHSHAHSHSRESISS